MDKLGTAVMVAEAAGVRALGLIRQVIVYKVDRVG